MQVWNGATFIERSLLREQGVVGLKSMEMKQLSVETHGLGIFIPMNFCKDDGKVLMDVD